MKKLAIFSLVLFCWGCSDKNLAELKSIKQNEAAIANASAPVLLTFAKSSVAAGVWEGNVAGDITGRLKTVLLNNPGEGSIWHVEFDWIVTAEEPAKSFTARLTGILNTKTGKVVMNGKVITGWLQGAQVHEEGQLTDPASLSFAGTIRIMPAASK